MSRHDDDKAKLARKYRYKYLSLDQAKIKCERLDKKVDICFEHLKAKDAEIAQLKDDCLELANAVNDEEKEPWLKYEIAKKIIEANK